MLNPFPELLTYGIFAPTLLRLAVALAFGSMAYIQWRRRHMLSTVKFPVIGGGAWIPWLSILITALTALALLVGYGTQWAAIVGVILSFKGALWAKRYPQFFPLCRAEYILLLVICLSLLLSGAGHPAFDLPL